MNQEISNLNKLELPKFNPDTTLLGGQGLTWEFDSNANVYYGATSKSVIEVRREGDEYFWQTYPNKNDFSFINTYFRLDVDYPGILDQISVDKLTTDAVSKYQGLRLLAQPFHDTVIMFISSTNRNIPLIKQSMQALYKNLGQAVQTDTGIRYLFPTVDQIAKTSLKSLESFKFGYRAPFIKASAEALSQLGELPSEEQEIRSALVQLPGVGPKVADCVMSFSLGFDNIIPQDVWVRRIFSEHYGIDNSSKYQDVISWYQKYWNGYAAWAGHFLFEYLRKQR